MKKIISLFKRDYEGNRQVYDEVVPGAEWVLAGEGRPTIKYDGTACMVRAGQLFKRYDRKLTKIAYRRKKSDPDFIPTVEDYKPAPEGWDAAEDTPNLHTGHWPGWLPVGGGPEDKWHRQAAANYHLDDGERVDLDDGTYELVGPKVQGNPYGLKHHHLWQHGSMTFRDFLQLKGEPNIDLTFTGICLWLADNPVEGLVWHHPDGRMVKIKRRDFGLAWPVEEAKL